MTAEPNEPVEPPDDDARDLPRDPTPGPVEKAADHNDDTDDPETDAMGINDKDPIDAALVGQPVDADHEPPD
jgi:hypothetical protein